MLQSSARPVYLISPALNEVTDVESAKFWIGRAQEEGALVVLLSTLHRYLGGKETVTEQCIADNTSALSEAFAELEALAAENPQHIILRVGQLLTLDGSDFASRILSVIRSEPTLALDMQREFEPTPVDDVAIVVLAMLRQIHLADDLWGTYHFSGVEPVSSYTFAEALLAEARQFEDLTAVELTTQEGGMTPEVWAPVADHTSLFHTFGIKNKAWRQGLARLVRAYYHDPSKETT